MVRACVGKPLAFSNIENPYAFVTGPIQSGDVVVTKQGVPCPLAPVILALVARTPRSVASESVITIAQ